MVATPMKLEDLLRFTGYTIDQTDVAGFTIALPTGNMAVPAMRLSSLTWRRDTPARPADSFYLEALPVLNPAYQPILLSHILDRFAGRRVAYDMPDEFGRAVRRWLNLNLGPASILNRRYLSTAVNLPLTTQDATTDNTGTDLARDATSDFPQGQLSGDLDYASMATDRSANTTSNTSYQGRMGVSVMALLEEQRAAYLNVDAEVLDAMESLFLGVWDRTERDDEIGTPYGAYGILGQHW